MGLDMYLTKETYVGAQYGHRGVDATVRILVNGEELPINPKRISTISESVGYWCKANAIHKWFVDNVQDGEDDCKKYYVPVEKLKELRDVCIQVKADKEKAPELLPTESGFFFGSTDYDNWYMEDIDQTIGLVNELMAEIEKEGGNRHADFFYQSSW